ncbi:MarC family NAAT transporter [Fodinibius sp.]|uniref:MarC family NAAT transporter n=1 Tax=Fodinibius sp. TaxID=1872440 RepID=UPI002ACD49A5|nr:MarC family NAAT transporter [Fodinibius sp.]MDZ7660407.1 MarC family NAAT transporter [Fodinibius sp.]
MFEEIINQSSTFSSYLMGTTTLFVAAFTAIISVANPLAAMPVFLSLTEKNSDLERISVAKKSSLYMFLVLIIFLLAGTYIMSFFGISLSGIRIAGGLIILRAAYAMLNPEVTEHRISEEAQEAAKDKQDISFSPMAMPMLSGPGSIAVVIGLGSQAQGIWDFAIISIAIVLVALISYGVLRLAPFSAKYIGPTGMNIITRMMGFIAMAIGVQFILNGVSMFFGV